MEKETYKCDNCGKNIKVEKGTNPECCGKPMKKLSMNICTQPAHAEHARPMEDEDSCDDFRAGE